MGVRLELNVGGIYRDETGRMFKVLNHALTTNEATVLVVEDLQSLKWYVTNDDRFLSKMAVHVLERWG